MIADPLNCFIILKSKSFEGNTEKTTNFYNVPYSRSSIEQENLKEALERPSIPDGLFGLPPANTLLPKNFDILPKNPELSEKPLKIAESEGLEVWY